MEFFRVVDGTATVTDVMRISANGLQVTVMCISFSCIIIDSISEVECTLNASLWMTESTSGPEKPMLLIPTDSLLNRWRKKTKKRLANPDSPGNGHYNADFDCVVCTLQPD